jgi:ADP-heptose:LPS heptosyltransferase
LTRLWIRAPDHLGDGVQAWGVIAALARVCPGATVAGPGWAPVIYRGLPLAFTGREGRPRGEVAVLLKPSFSAAWHARRFDVRIGLASDGRSLLLTDSLPSQSGHRADSYRRLGARALERLGAAAAHMPDPAFAVTGEERQAAHALCDGETVLLLPGTNSPETARWKGFRGLADTMSARGRRPLFAAGPGEDDMLSTLAGPHRRLPPPELPLLAALAVEIVAAGGSVVANDSGHGHLAAAAIRAAGLDATQVVVVYGSTDPDQTGPPGTTAWPGPRPPCWPCYAKRCDIGTPCLEAPIDGLLVRLGVQL